MEKQTTDSDMRTVVKDDELREEVVVEAAAHSPISNERHGSRGRKHRRWAERRFDWRAARARRDTCRRSKWETKPGTVLQRKKPTRMNMTDLTNMG